MSRYYMRHDDSNIEILVSEGSRKNAEAFGWRVVGQDPDPDPGVITDEREGSENGES